MISNAPAYVKFSSKGQVVIPAGIRKKLGIRNGTRALVQVTDDGITIKPVTRKAIDRGFGILKRSNRGKSFAEEWAEHKREEIEIEERKLARHRV